MAFIEMNYVDTLKKAERLEELAGELRNIALADLPNLGSAVNRSWKGAASMLHQKRSRSLEQQIAAQEKKLRSTASTLRTAAATYRRLELLSKTIFGF